MGLGQEPSKGSEPRDVIDSSLDIDITSKTDEYLVKLYTLIKENRDALGCPIGSTSFPYLFVTNDLWGKFAQTIQLFDKQKLQVAPSTLLELLKCLLESFDEESNHHHNGGCHGCCSFYFSCSRDNIQNIYTNLSSQLRSN